MPRTKSLITYPRLNDCRGNLNKKWYVEWSYRLPDNIERRHLERTYDGLCAGTADERYARAYAIIKEKTEWLKSGAYLCQDDRTEPVKQLQNDCRPEAALFEEERLRLTARYNVDKYIASLQATWAPKTKETYKARLGIFCDWVELELNDMPVTQISRSDLLPFFYYIVNNKGVSRLTCQKYEYQLKGFFAWLIDTGTMGTANPVYKIPRLGKVVDFAPAPIQADDRERLKAAIEKTDPWLWLACEIQYYCAIRPGTELRLLKVCDIDKKRSSITVRCENAKESRTETVPVPAALMDRMVKMGVFNYDRDYYVFGRYNYPGSEPHGKNTLRNKFNKYRDALGISRDHTFYSWKHSGATESIDNGMNIFELQDHLRHKSLESTIHYVQKHGKKRGDIEKYVSRL